MEGVAMMERIKDNEITPEKVAEFFLTKKELTPKKIQKLVYYAYAWFIALNNDSENDISNVLFAEQPEAWIHGPVFRSIYDKYKENRWHEVKQIKHAIVFENDDIQNLLETIWEKFGNYSADELEAMTHCEDPWRIARGDVSKIESSSAKINNSDIFRYYNGLAQKQFA